MAYPIGRGRAGSESPLRWEKGVGGEGLTGSFGVSRRTRPATAFADRYTDPHPALTRHLLPSGEGTRLSAGPSSRALPSLWSPCPRCARCDQTLSSLPVILRLDRRIGVTPYGRRSGRTDPRVEPEDDDGSKGADIKPAPEFPSPFNTPTVSPTVLPDRARRCATLWLSPSQERRLGTQAPKRRRGPVERDCPGRNPGVRGVSGRLARRGPRDWDLLSNRDRRSRAHKHPGARPPAEETVPPGARVNRPGRRQAMGPKITYAP